MTVVRLVAHHHVRAEPEPLEKVLLRVTVPHEAVHDAYVGGARVEVQPHREREPVAVSAFQPYDGPHRPVLFDDKTVNSPRRLRVVADADQPYVAHRLDTAVRDRRDQ